jgi:hypothetical protein
LIGALLVAVGSAATVWGAITTTRARRPGDIAASLIAALGLAVALIGGAAVLVPGFLR